MALTWKHPFTCMIAEPTGCGKTQFTFRLIEYSKLVMYPSPEKIVWCYSVYQNTFSKFPQIEFRNTLK